MSDIGDILMPDGMMRLSKVFCGCVTPENTYGAILAELERLERGEFKKDDDLASAVCDHLALSEHGTSIRSAWLTADGKATLAFLREYGIDWSDDTRNFVDSEGVYHSHT